MNNEACANCLVHGWKQVEDKTLLLQCKNCKVIQYCGKDCQLEHWFKVHRHHCHHFKDQAKNEPAQHKELNCLICLQVTVVGESNLRQIDNPNYACVHKLLLQRPPEVLHPHPFPITGDPADIREKAVIVLLQLVHKFQLTRPNVCQEELVTAVSTLVTRRLLIWRSRKIHPVSEVVISHCDYYEMLSKIEIKMETSTLVDPFQLWKIIMLVAQIEREVNNSKLAKFLKDPLVSQPDYIKKRLSEGTNNTSRYITVANKVLEALATKVISYQELLKIICGGSLEKKCSFCSTEVVINSEHFSNGQLYASNIFFTRLLLDMYSCGGGDCISRGIRMLNDHLRFEGALLKMNIERKVNTCDFCFQRTPVKQEGSNTPDIHRCSYCRTTMYCSMDCLHRDWKIHLKVCKKDKEGRKKKLCASGRREVARREKEETELGLQSLRF